MIGIDNHGFNIQENKLAARTHLGFDRVQNVIKYVNDETLRLSNREIDQNQMKAKRLIEEARKRETLEYLSVERERLQFSVEEIHSRMYEFYDAVLEERSFVNRYLQEYEMRLVYPKSKWSLKVAKFTLRIMDDLHEVGDESSPQYALRELENKAINECQQIVRNILNLQPLLWNTSIKHYLDKTMPTTQPEKAASIAFRYYAIEALSLYAEYMIKFREKQRRMDIFEFLDVRYLALLIPVLKQTLVRLTDHLRTPPTVINCPTISSIIKNEEEAEKELEERILLPISVQALRNLLDLVQYLAELPILVQSVLVEHLLNCTFNPAAAPISNLHVSVVNNDNKNKNAPKLVGKKEVKQEVPLPAAAYSFNQLHLFHDIIAILCHHGSILRNSTPAELSDAAIINVEVAPTSGKAKRSRSARKQKVVTQASTALSAAPATSSAMFQHPSGRKFILGTGRRNLFHTSIIPDLLQCAIYYQTIVTIQLPTFRKVNPLPSVAPPPKSKGAAVVGAVENDSANVDKNHINEIMKVWESSLLPLAFRAVQRTLVILGRPGHVGSLVPREKIFLQTLDDIIIAVADVTSVYYQHHPQYPQALAHRLAWALVQSIHYVSYHRLSAIFVQQSLLKLCFAAALPMYYFQTSVAADPIREALAKTIQEALTPPPVPPNGVNGRPNMANINSNNNAEDSREEDNNTVTNNRNIMAKYRETVNKYPEELLRDELMIMTQRILAAFAVHHKQSLTITRLCCMNLRILFREIFVKRTQCEDLLSMNLSSLCAPFTASLTKLTVLRKDGGAEDDDDGENGVEGGDTMMLMQDSMPSSPVAKPNFSTSLFTAYSNEEDDSSSQQSGSVNGDSKLKKNTKQVNGKLSTKKLASKSAAIKSQSNVSSTNPQHQTSVTFAITDEQSVDSYASFNSHESQESQESQEGDDHEEDEEESLEGANGRIKNGGSSNNSNSNSMVNNEVDNNINNNMYNNKQKLKISSMKTRLGGVLEEPTLDEQEIDNDEDDEANKDLDDHDDDDPRDHDYDGNFDGGDSLTTIGNHTYTEGIAILPPPSKESKEPKLSNKQKQQLKSSANKSTSSASTKKDASAGGDNGVYPSSSFGTSTLKLMASSTFSIDNYAPVKIFKNLPNPLIPKTLIETNSSVHDNLFGNEEKKDDGKSKDKGHDSGSVNSETTATSYTATLSANASQGAVEEKEKNALKKNAQKVLAKNSAMAGANNNMIMYVTLADILMSAAETHLSHAETFEQILLLVEHIGSKSYLCKYVLVETGLPMILQRYLQSRPANLYLVALTQVCLDALEI